MAVPAAFLDMLALADAGWRPVLQRGLEAVDAADSCYLPTLANAAYLPNGGRLFAAFAQPLDQVRYVLVGEGPYPRPESATGVCFMDGAVQSLWSEKGLSTQVNRATSLRNFIKMLLVAQGDLVADDTGAIALAKVSLKARATGSVWIQILPDLQNNLQQRGFLLLNAALVWRSEIAPVKDARAWQPFLATVLAALLDHAAAQSRPAPMLVLWGKIAEQLRAVPQYEKFPKALAEHPYNLSFIQNPAMQDLFGPMRLLQR